ncbi:hypothetical protein BDK51DRAFT_46016 [Blyttiomyces helicus]|uniref:Uncharacterized protein n=1 Tax=Blyttiomyces helicus TaxID=388810 RepID=A0A4P9WJ17_9FUNG|nr:hypothetical protein BDK51DRAFT_46016 [Blyttiomyces helicus]|eukprot:RKO92901.1 hypothetical protein BDK51DRAFT_46016 [Blyttiomyces helicus]
MKHITMEILNAYPDKPWDYYGLSKNPNITTEILIANPDKPWNYLVTDAPAVANDVAVVANQAAAIVADGAAIAQQRVKDRAIAQGRADLIPFVERYKNPVGLTDNEINLLLSAMSEVVNEEVQEKERRKQVMRNAVWKWISE